MFRHECSSEKQALFHNTLNASRLRMKISANLFQHPGANSATQSAGALRGFLIHKRPELIHSPVRKVRHEIFTWPSPPRNTQVRLFMKDEGHDCALEWLREHPRQRLGAHN